MTTSKAVGVLVRSGVELVLMIGGFVEVISDHWDRAAYFAACAAVIIAQDCRRNLLERIAP